MSLQEPIEGRVSVPQHGLDAPIQEPEVDKDFVRNEFYADRSKRIRELALKGDEAMARDLHLQELSDAKAYEIVAELHGVDPLQETGGLENMSEFAIMDRLVRLGVQRADQAELAANDPDFLSIQEELGNVTRMVNERNAALYEERKLNPSMNPAEFMERFQPIVVGDDTRQRWSATLSAIDKKLKQIDSRWNVWTHPSTKAAAKALTGIYGVAPWHETMAGESGVISTGDISGVRPITKVQRDRYQQPEREGALVETEPGVYEKSPMDRQLIEEEVQGEIGGVDEQGRPRMGPTMQRRRETPEEAKARVEQGFTEQQPKPHVSGMELGFEALGGAIGKTPAAAVEQYVNAFGDTVIGGSVKAAKWAWELGSIVAQGWSGGMLDLGFNPFQTPQDWVSGPDGNPIPVDLPFGLPELLAGVSRQGIHDQMAHEIDDYRGRLALQASSEQPWFHWLATNTAAFLGGVQGFSMMAGPLMAAGGKAGQAAMVPRGTVLKGLSDVASGGLKFGTKGSEHAARMLKIRSAIGNLGGQAIALGGYEAATAASTPQELAERFKHGAMMAPVFVAAGAMGHRAEMLLRRRRMPRHVSRAIGGALEGTIFSAFEAVSGEGTAPLFGKTAEGESLWSFLKEPSTEKLETFLRTMAINMLGMAALKMSHGRSAADEFTLGREAASKRWQFEKARSDVRIGFEREQLVREHGEVAAMERSGKVFERPVLPDLLRRKHGEAFKEVSEQLFKEAEAVRELEKQGTGAFTPSQRALLDTLGKKRIKGPQAIEFEGAPNLFGRLGDIAKRRQLGRTKALGWKGEQLAGEISLVLTRNAKGELIGRAGWGKSATTKDWIEGRDVPSVPDMGIEALAKKVGVPNTPDFRHGLVSIHEHPSGGAFSQSDVRWYLKTLGNLNPQFVVDSEGAHLLQPGPQAKDPVMSFLLTSLMKQEAWSKPLFEKVARAEALTREERSQVQAKMEEGYHNVADFAEKIGWQYKRLTFQEAQRVLDKWAKSGQLPTEPPPPSAGEAKVSEAARRLGIGEPDVVPHREIDRAEVQRTVDDWFRREGERYEKERGHPAALFEGAAVERAPISFGKDREFVEPAIKRLFDELEPMLSGASALTPTPANLVQVMRAFGLAGKTPRGVLMRTVEQDAALRADREEAARQVREFRQKMLPEDLRVSETRPRIEETGLEKASMADQQRALDKMFSAQKESEYARDYRAWRVRMGEQLSKWRKALGEIGKAFTKGGREKAAQWVEKLGLRGQRAKLAKEWEPLITAELDRLSEGFLASRYNASADMLHVFEPLMAVKEPAKRQELINNSIEYAMLRDLEASHEREFVVGKDAQGNPIKQKRPTPLPMGVTIEAVKERLDRFARHPEFQTIKEHYGRMREALDAAFSSMLARGLVTPEMHRPDYFPRRVADFGELYNAVMGEPSTQRVRERARGYTKLRKGSERLLDPRPEVLQSYLTKVRIDNEIHDFYERVGKEISNEELANVGLTLTDIEKMDPATWKATRQALDDAGLVVIDTKAGTIGRHKIETHPAFLGIIAELRAAGVDMPDPIEFGRQLRPDHARGRYLVPRGVYEALLAARNSSPLFNMMPLTATRRFIGQWFKLPALRGLLGTKTVRRIARNAVTDATSIVVKHPEGLQALREILRPESVGATNRVVRFLNESDPNAAAKKWSELTPFERSMAEEIRLYGTSKTGIFTHELAREDPAWIRKILPQEDAMLHKVLRTLVGDFELAQRFDDFGENWFKVALFMRERLARFRNLGETGVPKDALPADLEATRAAHLRVGEVLVSYKWLTPAERVLGSGLLIPFYTWAKGNAQGVVAALLRQPLKVGARAGLALALVQLWNNLMFQEDEQMLRTSHPDVASRLHFFTGVHDEFGQPMVIDFEDSLTEALGFMWGLNEAPAKLIDAMQHGDPSLFIRDVVVGGAETMKKTWLEWLAPWVRDMAGESYSSKYATLGERSENVFNDDFVTSFRPLADLRSLGAFGDAADKSLGQKVASYLPFVGFADTFSGLPAEQRAGQFMAGRLQRADARISVVVKRGLKRFVAGMENPDRQDGSTQMRRAFDEAWNDVGPAMEEQGRSQVHLLARFVEAAEREQLKRRTAKVGGPIPPKFHSLSRSQKAEFLLWLLEQQKEK